MDLLPYTKRAIPFLSDFDTRISQRLIANCAVGGWTCRRFSESRFYWQPDLYEMNKRLAELEDDRDAGKPGAEQKLTSFITERTHLVDTIVQVSSILLSVSETNLSDRAAPNWRNGPRKKQRPKLVIRAKEETKDARSE